MRDSMCIIHSVLVHISGMKGDEKSTKTLESSEDKTVPITDGWMDGWPFNNTSKRKKTNYHRCLFWSDRGPSTVPILAPNTRLLPWKLSN